MSTFSNAPTQEIGGGGLSSREGKRNKKAQALSALLSASALGLFLEGCGGGSSPSTSPSESNIYMLTGGHNARIMDSDTAGTGMVDATDANSVIFTDLYSSPDQFAFTRSGDNLIVNAAGVLSSDGETTETDPIRVEIADYFLRPSAFVFSFNAPGEGEEGAVSMSLGVPDNVDPDMTAPAEGVVVSLFVGGSQSGEELFGGDGSDILYGGRGADTLDGGKGADILDGGEGSGDSASYAGSQSLDEAPVIGRPLA